MTTTQQPIQIGDRPLRRMRLYTTASFLIIVSLFCIIAIVRSEQPGVVWLYAVTGALTVDYSRHWEKAPAWWLTAVALAVTLAVCTFAVIIRDPWGVVFLAVILGVIVGRQRHWAVAIGLGAAVMLAPIGVAAIIAPSGGLGPFIRGAILLYAAMTFAFLLNRYGFGLYLEIDAARQMSADLAVAEERYRFAADLHDIQGHTLHVIKLKTQLAERLLDRDPAAAKGHLREAQQLIAETLANTKNLAYGNRHVAVASELANAEQLFSAAGIDWRVTGEPQPHAHDELFGLVVREATTNILRHAQPTTVAVTLEPGRLVVTNDGSPATARSASGLARLAERFAAAGGALRTSSVDGVFTTEAVIR